MKLSEMMKTLYKAEQGICEERAKPEGADPTVYL